MLLDLEQEGVEDPATARRRVNGRDLSRPMPKLVSDRRRYRRVAVHMAGRFMREDRREYPCVVTNMSAGGMALTTDTKAKTGERIVAYFDDFGWIEGIVARQLDSGFAVQINASAHKREKIANKLTWLMNRDCLGLGEERGHERLVPRNPLSKIIMPNGEVEDCRVIDVSLSGASVASPSRPPLGTAVVLGRMRGRVVRHHNQGWAIQFAALQDPDSLAHSFG